MEIQLNRIILFGQDVNRLKQFYLEHFNCKLIEEIESEWVVLQAGKIELAFHRIGVAYDTVKDKPFKANSNTKLVFEVAGDLVAFKEKLSARGVLLQEIKSFPGICALFCDGEDPEGNVFQLQKNLG